jgi:beta-phosphoglucomutase-like phosphatase (HAD superfamily)
MKIDHSLKGKIKRVLFDLDGTLWDTQKHHAFVETQLMSEHGVQISPEEVSAKYAGRPTELVFKEILNCDDVLASELMRRKWERVFPVASKAEQLCNLRELFSKLKERGIQFSIGTASPVRWAHDLLRVNGLAEWFDVKDVVGGDMVRSGKPSPDIWIMAAGDVSPEECLVVEDGTAGIEGAISAGMPCALILPRRYDSAIEIQSAMDILDLL